MKIQGLRNFTRIACGDSHTLLINQSGEIYSCGANQFGQCGVSESKTFATQNSRGSSSSSANRKLMSGSSSSSLASGPRGSITSSKGVSAFFVSQISHYPCVGRPTLIDSLKSEFIVDATCGEQHSIVLTRHGDLYTFGAKADKSGSSNQGPTAQNFSSGFYHYQTGHLLSFQKVF